MASDKSSFADSPAPENQIERILVPFDHKLSGAAVGNHRRGRELHGEWHALHFNEFAGKLVQSGGEFFPLAGG